MVIVFYLYFADYQHCATFYLELCAMTAQSALQKHHQ